MKSSFFDGKTTLAADDVTFQDCLEQAEICCEQARLAAQCRRYKAACGLFSTAITLYQRAIAVDGVCYPTVARRLRDIEMEMAAYTELNKSLARPLLKRD